MSIIPITILGISSYYTSVNSQRQKVFSMMENNTISMGKNVDEVMKNIHNILYLIFIDENIQKILTGTKFSDNDTNTYTQFSKLNELFGKYFFEDYYENYSNLASLILYDNSGGSYIFKNVTLVNTDLGKSDEWLKKARESADAINWLGVSKVQDSNKKNNYLLEFSISLKDLADKKPFTTLGVIRIAYYESIFNNTYTNYSNEGNFSYMIIDKDGLIISHSDKGKIQKNVSNTAYFKKIMNGSSGAFRDVINGQDYLISYSKINGYDWRVVELTPYSYVTSKIKNIRTITLIISVVSLVGINIISLIVSKRITRPLMELHKGMKEVQNGNLDICVSKTSNDEIGKIQNSFNYMVIRLKDSISKIIDVEQQKKEEEIKALQHQVNPHFLYNSLNTIRLMAVLSKNDGIALMTEALTRLMKNAVGTEGFMVKVASELNNIRDFIFIQQMRYNGCICVEYDIDQSIYEYLVPNLILQPLVENAIFHGIEPKKAFGKLIIKGVMENSQLMFTIEDDGVGMTNEQIMKVFSEDKGNKNFYHIGLKNVDNRIKLNFGVNYGVKIFSNVEKGTKVVVLLPIIEDRMDEKNA